jgi:hypothetical protein
MSDEKHTPVNWEYQENADKYTHIIRGPNNEFILQLPQDSSGKTEARARLIVKCVNAHDDLLAACKALAESNEDLGIVIDKAKAAIEKAEPKE